MAAAPVATELARRTLRTVERGHRFRTGMKLDSVQVVGDVQ
jgi:hypothetical protein